MRSRKQRYLHTDTWSRTVPPLVEFHSLASTCNLSSHASRPQFHALWGKAKVQKSLLCPFPLSLYGKHAIKQDTGRMTAHAKQGTSARLAQPNGLSLTVKRRFERHHLGKPGALPAMYPAFSLPCTPCCSAAPASTIALIKHWVSKAVPGTVGTAQVQRVCEKRTSSRSSPKKPPCASIMA